MNRKFRRWWKRLFGTSALTRAAVVTPEPAQRKRMKIAPSAAVVSKYVNNGEAIEAFTLPEPPEGVVNRAAQVDGHALLALDDMTGLTDGYAQTAYSSFFKEGLGFLGYPYLAELSQRTEYRRPVEIIAKEMTRKWIKFTAVGDGDKSEKIKLIEADFKKFSVRELFRKAAEGDGYMGRHHLFIRTGDNDQPQELIRPLIADPRKYSKGFLKGFTSVEAMWAYPSAFNATNPLEPDYYRPPMWFVQGQTIHATRLLTFVSRPMPDMLKPAYAFGGLALTQIMKPYVDNWLETRQSVNDLIQLFSQAVLKTDMQAVLEGDGADDLMRRVDLFNRTRSNRGTMVLDMNAEDFVNVSAPISGLDKLQAQAQEHMAAACGIPLVVLLGVTPSGLNASSDGEIRTFYQWVRDVQEQLFLPNLTIVLQLIQLHLFGEIDPAIGIEFEPLWEDDAATKATTGKAKADTAAVYINAGVVDPEEERQRLAHDEDGMYAGVDLSGPPPEPPADPAEEGDPEDDDDGPPGGGAEDEAFLAADEEHWITVHPNGRGKGEGEPLLIEGSPGGGYTVKGGAGGKLDGQKIAPKSMSKPRDGRGRPQLTPYQEARGKAEAATAHAKGTGHADHHRMAHELHRQALTEEGGTTETDRHHAGRMQEHADALHKHYLGEANAASERADAASKAAKSAEGHKAAHAAHQEAVRAWTEAYQWARAAENGEAANAAAMVDHHGRQMGAHGWEFQKSQKREKTKARTSEFQNSEKGQEKAAIEKRFQSHSLEDIRSHFKERHGLDLENGSNAVRDFKTAKKAFYKDWGNLTPEQRQERTEKLNDLRAAARGRPGTMVRGHTEHDLTDGSANAKASRKALGHLAAALEHLEAQGFNVKEALTHKPVIFHPGSTGKAIGHAWQHQNRGHLGLSGAKTNDAWHAEQERRNADRAAAGKSPWIVDHDFRTVAIHELAHAMGMQPHVDSPGKLQDKLRKMFPMDGERYKWIKDNISEYGASNRYETDAELAAKVTHPSYVRGTLPQELEDHVDELFHRRK